MKAKFLNRSGAAAYLKAKTGMYTSDTLARLACYGGGPRFRRMGRVPIYMVEDLDAWIDSKTTELLISNHQPAGDSDDT